MDIAILAKGIPLVIAGSLGTIFSRNSINNALISLEVPKVLERLREAFPADLKSQGSGSGIVEPSLNRESLDSPTSAPLKENEKTLTRRTGWTLTWNVLVAPLSAQQLVTCVTAASTTFVFDTLTYFSGGRQE